MKRFLTFLMKNWVAVILLVAVVWLGSMVYRGRPQSAPPVAGTQQGQQILPEDPNGDPTFQAGAPVVQDPAAPAPKRVDPNEGLEDISIFPADIDGNAPEVAVSDYQNITGANPRVGNNRWAIDKRTGKRINLYQSDQRTEWARSVSDVNILIPFAPGSVTYVERSGMQVASDGLLKLTEPEDPPLEESDGYALVRVDESNLDSVPPALRASVRRDAFGPEATLFVQVPIVLLNGGGQEPVATVQAIPVQPVR